MKKQLQFAAITLLCGLAFGLAAQDVPPPFGRGGPGPMRQGLKLVKQFDKDGDGRLNKQERQAARDYLKKEREEGRTRAFGPRGGFGRGGIQEPAKPGPRISPADVYPIPDVPLYEPTVLRTFFLEFEDEDWEKEMAEFYRSDVEVPARLMVDGRAYPNIGVRFRGNSSFFGVGEGRKRSLNLTLDYADPNQRLYGYKTLELLNAHEDPTFMRTVLFSHVARHYLPALNANFVKIVINGESWGIYVNQQQFNRDFLKEWFGTTKGIRWKMRANPGGGSGLAYFGDNLEPYKRIYELKTAGGEKAWPGFVQMCRTLNQTPLDQLEDALSPLLNIDRVLWFVALDNVLINDDGYWIRASDFNIYQDTQGRFHTLQHDVNETFRTPGGPGFFRGGPGGGRGFGGGPGRGGGAISRGLDLDPLFGMDDSSKPLLNRLLAVPGLKARYLHHVRTIAEESLDWNKLGPLATQFQALLEEEVKADTHKLYAFDAFRNGVAGETKDEGYRGPFQPPNLKSFVEQRRNYLLNYPEIKKPTPKIKAASHQVLRNGSLVAGDPKPEDSVQISVEVNLEVKPDRVLLYYAPAKEAPFLRIEMKKTEEGRYTSIIPPMKAKAEVYYYIEAASASQGTTTFLPSAAEFGALKFKVQG